MMLVAASQHFRDQCGVPLVERGQLAFPAARFRMHAIALQILREDVPETVQLAVFAQQMTAAEQLRRDIPDAHAR